MKRKVLSAVLAATMVLSMAACGNEPANSDNNSTPAPSNNTAAPSNNTAAPADNTAAPTAVPDNRTEGEKLADQYNGFVETPMNLNGRTIRIACSLGSRYNYVKNKETGENDIDATNDATKEIIRILGEIEKDYNCKFEVTPSRKGKDIVKDLLAGKAEGKMPYDIMDMGVSDTYLDQMYSQGFVMDMNDPAIKDIIKVDSNPWKAETQYGLYHGTQYAVCFVTQNSTNDLRNALLFNKDLADRYLTSIGGSSGLYKLVTDNKWTWAKFEELCAEIVKNSGGDVTPAGYGKENLIFPMTVFSNNGKIADIKDGKLTYVANTDQNTIDAANWIVKLRENGYLAPNYDVKTGEKDSSGKDIKVAAEGKIDYTAFTQGKCVFFFDFYGDLQKLTNNSAGSDGVQTVTDYAFGLVPHPLGPNGDKYHGVTYSNDMKMICAGIEKPEEVAAVLVAIANRTAKTPENFYEMEMKNNTLSGEEDLPMIQIMYEDMRCDLSRTVTGHAIGSACGAILELSKTPAQAFEEIAAKTQELYDGTDKSKYVTLD